MATVREDISFKTLDGLLIRGWLFPAAKRGPGVIMTPGFNCIKEDFYPGLPETFQRAGVSVLLYDPRNTGKSEGLPRNQIDPVRQSEDYSDAFTYMSRLDGVDPSRIAFWGVSLSASLVLPAAAFDKRAAAVIAVAPLFYYDYMTTEWPKLIGKTIRDRESQLDGRPPFYIPALESRGVVPTGSRMNAPMESKELSHNPHASTLQSYYKMGLFQPIPIAMLPGIYPTPIMFVTPENDIISKTQVQIEFFESLRQPKKFHLALGKGHVDVLAGDYGAMAKAQIDFLWQAVEGRLHGQNKGA